MSSTKVLERLPTVPIGQGAIEKYEVRRILLDGGQQLGDVARPRNVIAVGDEPVTQEVAKSIATRGNHYSATSASVVA